MIPKELQKSLDKIDKVRQELKTAEGAASKEIMNILKSIVVNCPPLLAFRWTQYTPHFNDGDVCEFGIGDLEFQFDDSIQDENDGYDNFLGSWQLDKFFKAKVDILNHEIVTVLKPAVDDAVATFNKLREMEKEMQAMFGDGYQITVTKNGVEVEHYDHD